MSNIFEKAAKVQLRFSSNRGANSVTVEDLFTLPLTSTTGRINLNDLAKAVAKKLRESSEDNFVGVSPTNALETLRLDILKRVIELREEDNAAALAAKSDSERKTYIKGLIAKKQNEELDGLSLADLKKL